MFNAVRSANVSPLVAFAIEVFQKLLALRRCASSVKASPVRRPPRWPRSRPIQIESTGLSVRAFSTLARFFVRIVLAL